eukprot:TRINITY_DN44910_c0_g1_i1.p1 TRINITY_DN44910_c0_g1~~TRINITY_DN44910_c0_g1_i1.p1  ORF type:complete len:214 (+),score=24.54 TRINITY_DN44910_c0_g1_i1:84-725(+)
MAREAPVEFVPLATVGSAQPKWRSDTSPDLPLWGLKVPDYSTYLNESLRKIEFRRDFNMSVAALERFDTDTGDWLEANFADEPLTKNTVLWVGFVPGTNPIEGLRNFYGCESEAELMEHFRNGIQRKMAPCACQAIPDRFFHAALEATSLGESHGMCVLGLRDPTLELGTGSAPGYGTTWFPTAKDIVPEGGQFIFLSQEQKRYQAEVRTPRG